MSILLFRTSTIQTYKQHVNTGLRVANDAYATPNVVALTTQHPLCISLSSGAKSVAKQRYFHPEKLLAVVFATMRTGITICTLRVGLIIFGKFITPTYGGACFLNYLRKNNKTVCRQMRYKWYLIFSSLFYTFCNFSIVFLDIYEGSFE